MKTIKFIGLFIVLLAFIAMPLSAFAQDTTPEPTPIETLAPDVTPPPFDFSQFDLNKIVAMIGVIVALFQALLASSAVGALSSALTNIGKALGLVKDGQALNVMPIIGGALLVVVIAAVLLNPEAANIESLSGMVLLASNVLTALVALIVSVTGVFGGAKLWHFLTKGTPVIGKSYKNELNRAQEKSAPVVKVA